MRTTRRARRPLRHFGLGVGTLSWVTPDGCKVLLASARNTWMYEWGQIATQVFGRGNLAYVPAAFYVEYDNVATPSTTVPVPTVNRQDGISYYLALSSSPTVDYLRVPFLLQPGIDIDPAFTSFLSPPFGNRLSFHSLTSGTAGVNGKAFTNAANSKVYGLAVVATPVPGDHTQDVVWARLYYNVSDQTIKPVSGQLSLDYQLTMP